MIDLTLPHRAAQPDDAPALARLVNMAGEGLPAYLWEGMREAGQSVWDVGEARARREKGSFSFRNAVVREEAGEVVAALIGYPLADVPEPIDHDAMPAMFLPLQELENLAPATWYVNVLASLPERRGRGYGTELLEVAVQLAIGAGRRGLSIIVSDGNPGAQRLYERCGYRVRDRRPMIKEGWQNAGENWVLLVRDLQETD